MKKLIALILTTLLLTSLLSGCGSSDGKAKTVTPGKLTVATSPDFAPMEFVDPTKEGQDMYVGFDLTLAHHIADSMGLELMVMPMSFDACQTAVYAGTVDMAISGFSWTAERAENYLISDYYIAGDNETKQTIIVAADKAGQYTKAEDFAGMKIGAQAASTSRSTYRSPCSPPVCRLPS